MKPTDLGLSVMRSLAFLLLTPLLLLTGPALVARAEVRLPKVFSSHLVVERDQPVSVWGWAQPDETVTVQIAPYNYGGNPEVIGEF